MVNKNIKVYLVEDYNLTRIGLKSVIKKFKDIKLIGDSDNAKIAIQEILEIKPDVVLMDIGLSGINGLEATKTIKSLSPSTKVIILTSHSGEGEILAALGSGATGYCLKDMPSSLLEEVIKMVNEGVCWIDSSLAPYILKYLPEIEFLDNLKSIRQIDSKYKLSNRELAALKLLIKGKSNEDIAKELNISIHTAKAHLSSIFRKLSVKDRVQAAVKAVKEKLTE